MPMYLCLLIVPSTFVTCTVRTLWQVMLTIRWSLGHTHSREPASSLERLVKVPRFAPKTTCFFSWNDFIPLTINIQPDLTLQQFSLLFLFTSLSSSFLQHVRCVVRWTLVWVRFVKLPKGILRFVRSSLTKDLLSL